MLFSGVQDGGSSGAIYSPETWLYDGADWTLLSPSSTPGPRGDARIACDPVRHQIVLFGGTGSSGHLDDTWIMSVAPAAVSTFGSACGTPPMLSAPQSLPTLGSSFVSSTSFVPTGANAAFYALGLSTTQFGAFALPLPLDGFGLPGCLLLQPIIYFRHDFNGQFVHLNSAYIGTKANPIG